MWIYEFSYSFIKIFNIKYKKNLNWPFEESWIITKFGKFLIRSNTVDAFTVSTTVKDFVNKAMITYLENKDFIFVKN